MLGVLLMDLRYKLVLLNNFFEIDEGTPLHAEDGVPSPIWVIPAQGAYEMPIRKKLLTERFASNLKVVYEWAGVVGSSLHFAAIVCSPSGTRNSVCWPACRAMMFSSLNATKNLDTANSSMRITTTLVRLKHAM